MEGSPGVRQNMHCFILANQRGEMFSLGAWDRMLGCFFSEDSRLWQNLTGADWKPGNPQKYSSVFRGKGGMKRS